MIEISDSAYNARDDHLEDLKARLSEENYWDAYSEADELYGAMIE